MRTDANCGNRLAARRRTAHRLATQRLTVRRLMGRRRPAAASPRIQQWITDRSQACDSRRRTAITTICPKRIGRRVKMVRRKFLPYLRPQPPTLRRSPPARKRMALPTVPKAQDLAATGKGTGAVRSTIQSSGVQGAGVETGNLVVGTPAPMAPPGISDPQSLGAGVAKNADAMGGRSLGSSAAKLRWRIGPPRD